MVQEYWASMMLVLGKSTGCLVLLISVASATGCFITNCPPGGKRAVSPPLITRECESCGTNRAGRCYGPNICCSNEFGCLIGGPETVSCVLEARYTSMCQNPGKSCSGNSGVSINGQCAAHKVCCSSVTCTFDETCVREESRSEESLEYNGGGPLLSLTPAQNRVRSLLVSPANRLVDHSKIGAKFLVDDPPLPVVPRTMEVSSSL